MKYPDKLESTLTQACIDLHHARNLADVESVLTALEEFDQLKLPLPEWMMAWIVQTMQNPLMTAEENFKRPQPRDPFGVRKINNRIDRQLSEQQKLERAISKADCDRHVAMRNAAFMIASRMLLNDTGAYDELKGGLGYEWHSNTTDSQSLADPSNFEVLVEILRRETNFWQDGIKARGLSGKKTQRRMSASGADAHMP